MGTAEPLRAYDRLPRCTYCGGVIGVYEPAIQLIGDAAWTTSRAAQPDLLTGESEFVYHAVCYELSRRVATN